MGRYHLLIFTLLCAQVFAASPLTLRMQAKFVEEAGGPRTVQEWKHTARAVPGQTLVANEGKRRNCSRDDCVEEEFRTEVTPERLEGDVVRTRVRFLRKLGTESTRIEGVVYARPGEGGEFGFESVGDVEQKYRFHLTPVTADK